MMTEQLKAALDALAACPDSDAVADMMRRHGIRGHLQGCRTCPVARYLDEVGGVQANVSNTLAGIGDDWWTLPEPVALFVRRFDKWNYPDLIEA